MNDQNGLNVDGRRELEELSVVMLSFNRFDELRRNVRDLANDASESGCELIVVDNGSTDGSQRYLEKVARTRKEVTVVQNDENVGVGKGRNDGWRIAQRPFILSIDDDTRVTRGDIAQLVSILRSRPSVGIVFPRIVDVNTGKDLCKHGDQWARPANFHGACHLVRRKAVQKVGYNDEKCTFGGEELDLSIRVRAAGYEVLYTPKVTVRHNGRSRSRSRVEKIVRGREWAYNYTRVLAKHFPSVRSAVYAARVSVGQVANSLAELGVMAAIQVGIGCLLGFIKGREQYEKLPDSVLCYYEDQTLRPEFGNVPLMQKLVGRWRQ